MRHLKNLAIIRKSTQLFSIDRNTNEKYTHVRTDQCAVVDDEIVLVDNINYIVVSDDSNKTVFEVAKEYVESNNA